MFINAIAFSALLETLNLTQGTSKPNPGAFPTSTSTINNTTNSPGLTPSVSGSTVSNFNKVPGLSLLETVEPPPGTIDDNSCNIEPYNAPPVIYQTFAEFNEEMANVYRYRQQQSVNLGSWFVHENWMSPSLAKCASGKRSSELDVATGWGSLESARSLLERHWDTWITESDFGYLASIGINTVRLPIGYWNLGPYYCQDTPFANVAEVYVNSWSRIVRAINMAAAAGIGVLVDLHGAVGSQNGQPHSGISDGATGLFNNPSNMDKTVDVLMFLVQQLAPVNNVVGIQLLNEPKNVPELTDFYSRAITSMRQASPHAATIPLYIHNGFDLERFTDYVAGRSDFIVQDHHSYFVFTPSDEAEPASQHTIDINSTVSDTLYRASLKQHRNLVIDEWSCALTPESISSEPDKNKARQDFCTGQLNVYTNTTAGWSFWSYMKEDCEEDPGWCFKAAVNNSLPPTFFSYGQESMKDRWQVQALTTTIANMAVPPYPDTLAITASSGALAAGRRNEIHLEPYNNPQYHHRFEAVHLRRDWRRYDTGGSELTPGQRSLTKGYSDGFLAAKSFASVGISRLGFTEQFIRDIIAKLSPSVIVPGTESNYRDGFMKGLKDGENNVMSIINPS
ncbi:glycoside hydrolase superfamily [Collybia nuda]|uniref:Glycoside hydrolase superfamily n=1 Tax=Collybia nuda TaxID=64659 RepID=A0A9P5YCS1_9AGAR|nr:glycoside hydrolase superfamily [Collybia nuda]